MVVESGEAESASVVVVFASLIGPGDMLRFTCGDGVPNGRVTRVRSVRTFHCFLRGYCREDGGYSVHVADEAHVEIPFVVDFE